MKGFTKEIRIAIVAIIGLAILFFGLNFLKGVSLFSSEYTYYIKFSNISGLSSSSPIMADGYKVGVVKSINFDFNKRGEIVAEVGINQKLRVPVGTAAEISSDLLGNVQVDLVLGDVVGEYLQPLDTINGGVNAGTLGKVKEMIPLVEKMLPKVDSILASVNYILQDPALPNTLHHAEQVTYDLTNTTKEINTLMAGLNKEVPGLMGKADGVLNQASQAMGNTVAVTDNLSKLDLETSLNELSQTLNNLKSFTNELNQGNGSLGLLMRDRSFYDNLNNTMAHADSLLINFREHPKRYVHFSVFGKKDK
ncbi:MAG: MCE family protein [Prevotella sp.]|nr:MCE family protein [Prevotella sp.]MBP5508649.1 MCE family protein [Prevotella sp.]